MSSRLASKVVLIGWDAADWKIIDPLLKAGLMPTLSSMIEQGVMGNLSTLRPVLSPMLWNSIATGKSADKHGILGFVEPQPDGSGIRTVSSTSRKCKALWNILTQSGMTSNVVGWYASHPAEPISGVYVTEHFAHYDKARLGDHPPPPESVHPPSLADELAPLRVKPSEIGPYHLAPFVPKLGEIPNEVSRKLGALRKLLAKCSTVHNVATDVLERFPADFTAIYYEAIDHFCHGFMDFHPPKMSHISDQEFDWYKDVVTGIYRLHDMMLERTLDLAGPDATVILCSDHGFHSDHLRPPHRPGERDNPEAHHRHHGIFVMKGPHILKDERVYGAGLLDIAPTVLTLLGLPVGEDMDGKVLVQCFDRPVAIQRIKSWEDVSGDAGMHPKDKQVDPWEQQQALQQLIELGYLAAPTQNQADLIKLADRSSRINLAMTHQMAGRFEKAAEIFDRLSQENPSDSTLTLALAQCKLLLRKFDEAQKLVDSVPTDAKGSGQGDLIRGSIQFALRNYQAAIDLLRRADKSQPNLPHLHVQIGNAYLSMKRYDDAKRAYERALEIDGDSPFAFQGLGAVALYQGRHEEAVELLLRAVGLLHHFPIAHFGLGEALYRMGMYDRAIQAYEVALQQRLYMPAAHRRISTCFARLGRTQDAMLHRQRAQQMLDSRKKQVRTESQPPSAP